jgi:hypothetical protein
MIEKIILMINGKIKKRKIYEMIKKWNNLGRFEKMEEINVEEKNDEI